MNYNDELSPLNWQCPRCRVRHSQQKPMTFLRGSCSHDICRDCIDKLASRRKLSRQTATRKRTSEVSCPIDKCSYGKFLIDKINGTQDEEAVDLCKVEDSDDAKIAASAAAGIVKKEIKEERVNKNSNRDIEKRVKMEPKIYATRSTKEQKSAGKPQKSSKGNDEDNTPSIKQEVKNDPQTPSPKTLPQVKKPKIISPVPVTELINLKPLYEPGEKVYAAWWDPKHDPERRGKALWYPGKVKAWHTSNDGVVGKYGPNFVYDISFDDGDEVEDIDDFWVFRKDDYEITMHNEETGVDPIGVVKKFDKKSNDKWASIVGWYSVVVDGQEQLFSHLSDAMKAYDASVVREHGSLTWKSELNIPEDYPWIFSNTVDNSNCANATVTPLVAKSEHGGIQPGDTVMSVGSEDESSFSEDGREMVETEVKRRRLIIPSEIDLQRSPSSFWAVNKEDIEFTQQAFLTKPMFHLNSFVNRKDKDNEAFALFLREGVATPAFNSLPTEIDADMVASWTYAELRDALVQSDDPHGASQTALWLKKTTVGSFVIMRHEYPKCKFCPARLRDNNGEYIGPVYVIGVITKKVIPWSAEEINIAQSNMHDFHYQRCRIHNLCRVSWRMMGYKKSLKESTQTYINHICQATVTQICNHPSKMYTGGATTHSIRQDLWENATMSICSSEFPDRFDHS